jgi:hypothetical protein
MSRYSDTNKARTDESKKFRRYERKAIKSGLCPECHVRLRKYVDPDMTFYECPKCLNMFFGDE